IGLRRDLLGFALFHDGLRRVDSDGGALQLSFSFVSLGLERPRVHMDEHLSRADEVSFGDQNVRDPSRDLGVDVDLGRLDAAVAAGKALRQARRPQLEPRVIAAAREREHDDQPDQRLPEPLHGPIFLWPVGLSRGLARPGGLACGRFHGALRCVANRLAMSSVRNICHVSVRPYSIWRPLLAPSFHRFIDSGQTLALVFAAPALFSSCLRWSYASCADQPLSTSVAVRRISSLANCNWASSLATSAPRVTIVSRASTAAACASRSCGSVSDVSIRATTSPGETMSPSWGTISMTRPGIFVEMSTWVASTRPLTLTMPAGKSEASYCFQAMWPPASQPSTPAAPARITTYRGIFMCSPTKV